MKVYPLLIGMVILALTLGLVMGYNPASPVEQNATATVGVNEYISFTVTDNGTAGINFGDLNPGTSDSAELANPAVSLTVESETNVDINVSLKGTNFASGSNALGITNVTYNSTNTLPGTPLTTSYVLFWKQLISTTDETKNVYYWIDIPVSQPAGNYQGTFYFEAKDSAG